MSRAPDAVRGRELAVKTNIIAISIVVVSLAGTYLFVGAEDSRKQSAIDDDARACVLAIGYVILSEMAGEMGVNPQAGQQREAEDYAEECAEEGDVDVDDVLRVAGYERNRDGSYDLIEPLP